jgi:outer membrane protein assembly factor BamD (BamD/ComL family)
MKRVYKRRASKPAARRKGETMSVSGVSTQSAIPYYLQQTQNQQAQMQQDFQQLGQDLQSGNLSAAQSEFTSLQQLTQGTSSTSANSTTSNNPISQEFAQLSQDLKSGNLSAAQSDYSKLQQDFQSEGTRAHHTHHGHHLGGGGDSTDINQLFQQLGQELQSGNLSTAQQTYTTLQQDLQVNPAGTLYSGQSTQTNSVSAIA